MKNIVKILKYTKSYWLWYLSAGVFICVISLLSLVTPFLLKGVVDIIVSGIAGDSSGFSKVWLYLFLILITDVSVTTLTSYSQWIGDILTIRLQSFLSQKFYEKLLILDIGYYDKEQTGAIVSKLNRGIESVTDFIQAMLNNFLPFLKLISGFSFEAGSLPRITSIIFRHSKSLYTRLFLFPSDSFRQFSDSFCLIYY